MTPEHPGNGTRTRRNDGTGRSPTTPHGVEVHPVCTPTRPRGHRDIRTRMVACGQRAGLRTRGHICRGRLLLAVASQIPPDPVRMTAVVPTHRCGAVPDSHRVPSYDAPAWRTGADQLHGRSRGWNIPRPPPFTFRNVRGAQGCAGGCRIGNGLVDRAERPLVCLPRSDGKRKQEGAGGIPARSRHCEPDTARCPTSRTPGPHSARVRSGRTIPKRGLTLSMPPALRRVPPGAAPAAGPVSRATAAPVSRATAGPDRGAPAAPTGVPAVSDLPPVSDPVPA